MPKVKKPLFSFSAIGKLGADIIYTIRHKTTIVQAHAQPQDAKSTAQLSWRHMFQKVVALWHALSPAEKEQWEALARPKHMTGYAWFISQALRPNPGIYLPLQGGIMQGIVDMDGFAIQDLLDPVNPQDADTEAARDAAIADALEDCIDSHIHGWDGANWQKLLVESAALHNLRVKLFDGANGIDSSAEPVSYTKGKRALHVIARIYGGETADSLAAEVGNVASDGRFISDLVLFTRSNLLGFNGASWDRLRTHGTGILKVGRAEIGLSTPRLDAPGQVKAGPGQLYWIEVNPATGNSIVELTDDLNGLGAIVYDCFHTARESHMHQFDPPMEFTTGIWLKTFTNMNSLIFGYK